MITSAMMEPDHNKRSKTDKLLALMDRVEQDMETREENRMKRAEEEEGKRKKC
ncbi:MAG: hypothetical protein LBI29_04280 [Rickettsiales bacterium]|jgi:hypothetical protein|nr:hypothetical protein [Rickettsiales bacterium]